MTIEEIRKVERDYLTPGEIAEVLGTTAYSITTQVKEDRANGVKSFPFPVIYVGRRVKIPKRKFLEAMGVESGETA